MDADSRVAIGRGQKKKKKKGREGDRMRERMRHSDISNRPIPRKTNPDHWKCISIWTGDRRPAIDREGRNQPCGMGKVDELH